MKNVYIVNWKETTLGEDNVMSVECGTCDVAYSSEQDAVSKVKELVDEKTRECVDELGYDADSVSTTEEYDYGCVTAGSNTYEYSVYSVEVV